MDRSISNYTFLNKLMLVVHLCMIFIPIVGFVILFSPFGIHIFLTFLIGIFIPFFRNLAFFYLPAVGRFVNFLPFYCVGGVLLSR